MKVINYPVFIDLKPEERGIELTVSDRTSHKVVARSLLRPDMHPNLHKHFAEVIGKGNRQIKSRVWHDPKRNNQIQMTVAVDEQGIRRRTSIVHDPKSVRHYPDLFEQLEAVLKGLGKWHQKA